MPITKLEDLRPDPKNANRGTPRGHSIIERSVRERGAGRSGLAAADGTMIAGSQTLQKMAELGMKIKPVHTSGDEWVVVIRDDIAPGSEEATLLALEDNRSSEVGLEWEPDVLAAIAREFDVSALFYPHELADVAQMGGESVDPADLWKGMPEFENEAQAARTLHVHFPTADDCAAFCKLLELSITDNTKTVWYPSAPERGAYTFEADES